MSSGAGFGLLRMERAVRRICLLEHPSPDQRTGAPRVRYPWLPAPQIIREPLCVLIIRLVAMPHLAATVCSGGQGWMDGISYYQPHQTAADFIGNETYNYPFIHGQGPCPVGFRCRYSDVNIVTYQTGVTSNLRQIARPIQRVTTMMAGPNQIQHNQYFHIFTSATNPPPVGAWVEKVGQASGWTAGQIAFTCQNVAKANPPDVRMLCQTGVSGWAQAGDSGSPVFTCSNPRCTGGGNISVIFNGILWGGIPNVLYYFSSKGNMDAELPPYIVH